MALEISELVSDAWNATWRHRRLWLLGFLAGNATGTCSGGGNLPGSFPTSDSEDPFSELIPPGPEGAQLAEALQQLMPVLAGLAVGLAVLLLVLGIISIAAQGGVIASGVAAFERSPVSAGAAWRRGWRLFWRMAGMWLLYVLIALALAGLTLGPALMGVMRGTLAPAELVASAPGGILVLVLLSTILGVVVAYAQRAIVVDDAGPVQAIAMSLGLIRRELLNTLLVWVIGLALSIGAGIAIVVGALLLLIPFGIVIAIGVALAGANLGILGIPLAVVAFVVWLAAILVAAAAVNTYLWHYWTLAYLRLTGRGAPRESVIGAPA